MICSPIGRIASSPLIDTVGGTEHDLLQSSFNPRVTQHIDNQIMFFAAGIIVGHTRVPARGRRFGILNLQTLAILDQRHVVFAARVDFSAVLSGHSPV